MMAGCTISHQMKFDAVLFEHFYCVSPATIYTKHIDDAASSLLNKLIATLSCRPSSSTREEELNSQRSVFSHKSTLEKCALADFAILFISIHISSVAARYASQPLEIGFPSFSAQSTTEDYPNK